jgi:hypothetical protein
MSQTKKRSSRLRDLNGVQAFQLRSIQQRLRIKLDGCLDFRTP